MKQTKLAFVCIVILFSVVLFQNCDNSTSSKSIDSDLVGTWLWSSATFNGEPQTFPEISMTDSSTSGTVTFNSDRTWNSKEYYEATVVHTQGGTCSSSGSNLTVTTTTENGNPLNPHETETIFTRLQGVF